MGCDCVGRELILEKSPSSLIFYIRKPPNEQKMRKREVQRDVETEMNP